MDLLSRLRRCRGLTAPLLLLLAAGGVPHHHADHDGQRVHVDEAHGSHGIVTATDSERLPGVVSLAIPATPVLTAALPDLESPLPRVVALVESALWSAGHDPPHARGSRAPPLLLL